jgi:N-acyl amino acid synthase of PEP-CTERM/exosortase system
MTISVDPSELSLLEQYRHYFEAVPAKSESAIRESQRIRYQVYCVENPFESAEDHPDGLEEDEFDSRSSHSLLIHRPTGQAMGTVRLVMPLPDAPEQSFPMQRACADAAFKILPIERTAEVSRFSISKAFRRRSTDGLYEGVEGRGGRRSLMPLMTLGLIQALTRASAVYGISHWCATMEPSLLRLLATIGIRFRPLGGMVEYHGLRQPCYCEVGPMLDRVKGEHPEIWEVLTDGGQLLIRPPKAA